MINANESFERSPTLWLQQALTTMAGAWRTFDVELNGSIYGDFLSKMGRESGRHRVDLAIHEAIETCEFLPSIARLRQLIQKQPSGKTATHPANCSMCDGSTWAHRIDGVVRCPNWVIQESVEGSCKSATRRG